MDKSTILLSLLGSVISGAFGGAATRLFLDNRENKATVFALHEKWWGKEFAEHRDKIYRIIKNESLKSDFFSGINRIFKDDEIDHESWHSFTRIAFFFSDLNAYIDSKLISEKLCLRMFGNSQYSWFRPFIKEVRNKLVGNNPDIRWIKETIAFEAKLDKFLAKKRK